MARETNDLRRSLSTLRTNLFGVGFALAIFLVGLGMMGLAERISSIDHPLWRSFLIGAGGVIAATGLLSVGWELMGKRALSKEVLAVTGLAFQVEKAGLRNINTAYGELFDWDTAIRKSGDIDLVVAWANTWRESHASAWESWAQKKGGSARVLLPDVGNAEVLAELARKFNMEETKVRSRVQDAVQGFSSFGPMVEIRFTDVPLVWSYYGFSNDIVVTLHTMGKKKVHNVPAFLLDPTGSVGGFFGTQFESAWASGLETPRARRDASDTTRIQRLRSKIHSRKA